MTGSHDTPTVLRTRIDRARWTPTLDTVFTRCRDIQQVPPLGSGRDAAPRRCGCIRRQRLRSERRRAPAATLGPAAGMNNGRFEAYTH